MHQLKINEVGEDHQKFRLIAKKFQNSFLNELVFVSKSNYVTSFHILLKNQKSLNLKNISDTFEIKNINIIKLDFRPITTL